MHVQLLHEHISRTIRMSADEVANTGDTAGATGRDDAFLFAKRACVPGLFTPCPRPSRPTATTVRSFLNSPIASYTVHSIPESVQTRSRRVPLRVPANRRRGTAVTAALLAGIATYTRLDLSDPLCIRLSR
jgi:hypothetical protein